MPLRTRDKRKPGPAPTDWRGIKVQPAVKKATSIVNTILADGKEHLSSEVWAEANALGVGSKKSLYLAAKHLDVKYSGGGHHGPVYWRLPTFDARMENPEAAKSSEILKDKAPPTKQILREKIERENPGYDPIVAISKIANDPQVPLAVRLDCHREIAKFLVPQVKAAEITTEDQPIALEFRWQT